MKIQINARGTTMLDNQIVMSVFGNLTFFDEIFVGQLRLIIKVLRAFLGQVNNDGAWDNYT